MIIDISTESLPEQFRWDPANPVTGTTKFYVRVAEELARRGHRVDVTYDGPDKTLDGVKYWHRRGLDTNAADRADLVFDMNISRPHQRHFEDPRRFFQWTSFYNRPDLCNGGFFGDGFGTYNRLFLVSEFVHSTLLSDVRCPVTVLELGCDFETVQEPQLNLRPKRCVYTASPDRGLQFLKEIWPDVERETGYELVHSPYGEAFSDDDVMSLLDSSRFWVFPAIGTDSICAALEAQARGCIPFVVPHMGLPETLRYGIETDLFRFKADLISNLKATEDFTIDELDRAEALRLRPIPTWSDVVDKILEHM